MTGCAKRTPVPNLLSDQEVHNGSSSTHCQPFARWASESTSSILSTPKFNRSKRFPLFAGSEGGGSERGEGPQTYKLREDSVEVANLFVHNPEFRACDPVFRALPRR